MNLNELVIEMGKEHRKKMQLLDQASIGAPENDPELKSLTDNMKPENEGGISETEKAFSGGNPEREAERLTEMQMEFIRSRAADCNPGETAMGKASVILVQAFRDRARNMNEFAVHLNCFHETLLSLFANSENLDDFHTLVDAALAAGAKVGNDMAELKRKREDERDKKADEICGSN